MLPRRGPPLHKPKTHNVTCTAIQQPQARWNRYYGMASIRLKKSRVLESLAARERGWIGRCDQGTDGNTYATLTMPHKEGTAGDFVAQVIEHYHVQKVRQLIIQKPPYASSSS